MTNIWYEWQWVKFDIYGRVDDIAWGEALIANPYQADVYLGSDVKLRLVKRVVDSIDDLVFSCAFVVDGVLPDTFSNGDIIPQVYKDTISRQHSPVQAG